MAKKNKRTYGKQKQEPVRDDEEAEVVSENEEEKQEEEPEYAAHLRPSEKIALAAKTEDVEVILQLTRSKDANVRFAAVKQLCPCKVGKDVEEFWKRVFEMANDEDKRVRYQILHTLCDGSPNHLELKVFEALEGFNRDPDSDIRRKAHRALTSYLRTGKWNVL
eukprot:TRINITY_DN1063_c0_g2_i1.p1 TRINITY_DN1063_c0_g2~~TRINITY_DN1063_c0_g2_i1.p1  ORF type:complete len:164 (+),score=49.41 TRINITY_DN1063_c0_g2_i1:115-606(+)